LAASATDHHRRRRVCPELSKVFIGLGLPILQGYGLTETSPVLACNREGDNDPLTVGGRWKASRCAAPTTASYWRAARTSCSVIGKSTGYCGGDG